MKKPHADVTRWLQFMAALTWTECRSAAGLLAMFEAAIPSCDDRAAASEVLAAVILSLMDEHERLLQRVREQFGSPRAMPTLDESVDSALLGDASLGLRLRTLRASIQSRAALFDAEPARYDAHTRLLLAGNARTLREVVDPLLQRLEKLAGSHSTESAAEETEARLYAAYAIHLPAFRPHPDSFLALAGEAVR